MAALGFAFLLLSGIMTGMIGSDSEQSSAASILDSIRAVQQEVAELKESIQADNEQTLIYILDRMAALQKEFRGMVSNLSLRVEQLEDDVAQMNQTLLVEKLRQQMEDFQSVLACTGEPPSPQNGTTVHFERKHGSVVLYRCDVNFDEAENSTVRCHLGKWEGRPPLCNRCTEPESPLNGKVSCRKNSLGTRFLCQAQCDPGYEFRSGQKTTRYICDLNSGVWTPIYDFPNCEPLCNPLCQNGGKCTRGNKCTCTSEFSGERCERAKASRDCIDGWTEYFNTDHPSTSLIGDDESLKRIREQQDFCIGGTIKDVDCKAIWGDVLVDYKILNAFGLKCSKEGFVCNKHMKGEDCDDFTVRFLCECVEN